MTPQGGHGGPSHSLLELQNELETLSVYISADIWVVDVSGNLLVDSSSPYAQTMENAKCLMKDF